MSVARIVSQENRIAADDPVEAIVMRTSSVARGGISQFDPPIATEPR